MDELEWLEKHFNGYELLYLGPSILNFKADEVKRWRQLLLGAPKKSPQKTL
jgi:hypothetical protein